MNYIFIYSLVARRVYFFIIFLVGTTFQFLYAGYVVSNAGVFFILRSLKKLAKKVQIETYFNLRTNFSGSSTRTESCLRRCISRMHEKHSMVFGGMMTRLNINRNIDFYQGFIEVSEELFREEISWSKIVALYAFGARLAQFCAENDMEDLLRDISESLARFSDEHLAAYILAQGGWVRLLFTID